MSIYLNGIKIAGRGISGKSPYQVAVEGGYSGTEADFNAQLAAIGEAVVGFDELRDLVKNSKAEVEEAVASIPDSGNLATKAYVQEQMATLVTDIWYYGSTAPSNTKLFWIDSNTTTGGLKYYNGSAWVHVPVAWS